jgi:hypothetical protein
MVKNIYHNQAIYQRTPGGYIRSTMHPLPFELIVSPNVMYLCTHKPPGREAASHLQERIQPAPIKPYST